MLQFNAMRRFLSVSFLIVSFTAFGVISFITAKILGNSSVVTFQDLGVNINLTGAYGLFIGMIVLLLTLIITKKKSGLEFWEVVEKSAVAFIPFLLYIFALPTLLKGGLPHISECFVLLLSGFVCSILGHFVAYKMEVFDKLNHTFSKQGVKLLLLLILILIAGYITMVAIKYDNFGFVGTDSATFQHSMWTAGNCGEFFYTSSDGRSHFSIHNSIFLFFYFPFYYLFSHFMTFHVIKIVFLAVASIPLYKMSRKFLPPVPSFIMAISYLAHPFICLQNFDDFNDSQLGPFFIFLVFYYFYNEKFFKFAIFFILTMFLREDYALFMFLFSFYALWYKRWKWALFPAPFAFFWFFFSSKVVVPHFAEAGEGYKWIGVLYGSWGNTPGEVIKSVLSQPVKVIKHCFRGPLSPNGEYEQQAQRLQYLFYMLVPFLIVFIFIGVEWIIALPPIFETFLADHKRTTTIYMHYGIPILSVLSVACIQSLYRFGKVCDKYNISKKVGIHAASLAILAISMWVFYHYVIAEKIVNKDILRPVFNEKDFKQSDIDDLNKVVAELQKYKDTPERNIKIFMPRYVAPKLANRKRLVFVIAKEPVDDCDIFILHRASKDENTLIWMGMQKGQELDHSNEKLDFIMGLPENKNYYRHPTIGVPGKIDVYFKNDLK